MCLISCLRTQLTMLIQLYYYQGSSWIFFKTIVLLVNFTENFLILKLLEREKNLIWRSNQCNYSKFKDLYLLLLQVLPVYQ